MHWKVTFYLPSLLYEKKTILTSQSSQFTFQMIYFENVLKFLLPMNAYSILVCFQLLNFLIESETFFYLLELFLECSLMYIVQILDFRSRILSYFCLIEIRKLAISICIYLIYLAFFLSDSLSSLKRWLVQFSRFSIISFSYS